MTRKAWSKLDDVMGMSMFNVWAELDEAVGTIMRESYEIALYGISGQNSAEIAQKFKKIYEMSWRIRHITDDIGLFLPDEDLDDSNDLDDAPPF